MVKKVLAVALVASLAWCVSANADMSVGVDPGATWVGYMNVFEIDTTTYMFGSGWGPADLAAEFVGNELKLGPNTNCWNATDSYWVNQNDGTGNKYMEANMYFEAVGLQNELAEFSGHVNANTLDSGYVSQAFVKVLDPNAGWATVQTAFAPLVSGQDFSVSLTVNDASGLITQFGFMTTGLVADPAVDHGSVLIAAVPEPATLALLALGGLALIRRR